MTNEHTSLEKYSSHTLFSKGLRKGCVWKVSWRRNRDCNILIPSSSDYSSTSSSFCSAAQPGSWGPKPSVWRWLSLRHLISNNDWNSLPRTELCLPRIPTNSNCLWHRVIYLFDIHLLPVGVAIAPISTRPQVKVISSIFSTGCTCFLIDGWVEAQYVTSFHKFFNFQVRSRFWLFSLFFFSVYDPLVDNLFSC